MKIVYSFFFQLKYSDNSLVFFLWRTQPLPGRSQFPEEEDFKKKNKKKKKEEIDNRQEER
jgi:hypothetical protein